MFYSPAPGADVGAIFDLWEAVEERNARERAARGVVIIIERDGSRTVVDLATGQTQTASANQELVITQGGVTTYSDAPNNASGNPTSANPTTGTTVELRSNRVIPWLGPLSPTHSYVVVTDNATGDQMAYRAGVQGSFWKDRETGATMGTFFGDVTAKGEKFVPGHRDWNPNPASSTVVLQTTADWSQVRQQLDNFVSQVNAAPIPYSPFGTNSNSFAHQAVQYLGQPNPAPKTWEPSWNVPLPVPIPPRG